MKAMLVIGVSRETVREARGAIMDILKAHASESVQMAALSALCTICEVNNTTVSNCNFEVVQ